MNKLDFLQNKFPSYLEELDGSTPPLFGKMNVQQMIEHMIYAFQQADGKVPIPNTQPKELTEKMYQFMMSDRLFKDNTPNPYLPDEPPAPVYATKEEAIQMLRKEIECFIHTFQQTSDLRIENPFFGNLNFNEWTNLLHKHAMHHLRQFNVIPNA